jgi:hypothetical protein
MVPAARVRFLAVGVVAVVSVGGLAACGSKKPSAVAVRTTSATPTPTPTPTLRSPLTGLPVATLGPVVAVKIDNVGTYGQNGLDAADVVYAEEVEGGLTRLLALYSSTTPTTAGPVRSARESDLEVLGQYGKIALAFSGANAGVLREVRSANVRDDSYDAVTAAYSFDDARPSPYQFLVNVKQLVAQRPGVPAKDVGFRFSAAAPAQSAAKPARPARTITVRFPTTTLSATFAGGVYTISRDGRTLSTDGRPVTATNILLQTVSVQSSRFVDHNGSRTPYSVTIGHGTASVLRGGTSYAGTWARAGQASPTTWTASGGGALALNPGRTWVILVPVGAVVSYG